MKSFFSAIALLALLVVSAPVCAQTTEKAENVNDANANGLSAYFPSISVRYTCSLNGTSGGVVVQYTDGNGIQYFSPVLTAACTNVDNDNDKDHSINFSKTETVTLGNLTITVNPASFTVYPATCTRSGCQWRAEPGYDISISVIAN